MNTQLERLLQNAERVQSDEFLEIVEAYRDLFNRHRFRLGPSVGSISLVLRERYASVGLPPNQKCTASADQTRCAEGRARQTQRATPLYTGKVSAVPADFGGHAKQCSNRIN